MVSTEVFRQSSTSKCPPAKWEALRATVEQFYINEGQSAKEVLQILLRDFSFNASENQFKKQMKKWNFDKKNVRKDIMVQIARSRAKRSLGGKQSAFRVNKRPVADRNIDKFLARMELSPDDLLDMESPINALSPAWSVSSPIPLVSFDGITSQPSPGVGPSFSPIVCPGILRSAIPPYTKAYDYDLETDINPQASPRFYTPTIQISDNVGDVYSQNFLSGESIAIPPTFSDNETNQSMDVANNADNSHTNFHGRGYNPYESNQLSELQMEREQNPPYMSHAAKLDEISSIIYAQDLIRIQDFIESHKDDAHYPSEDYSRGFFKQPIRSTTAATSMRTNDRTWEPWSPPCWKCYRCLNDPSNILQSCTSCGPLSCDDCEM